MLGSVYLVMYFTILFRVMFWQLLPNEKLNFIVYSLSHTFCAKFKLNLNSRPLFYYFVTYVIYCYIEYSLY